MSKLSIMILTTPERENYLSRLHGELHAQIFENTAKSLVKISIHGGVESIGYKRNSLLDSCKSEYCCFVDDDDMVSPDYIKTILAALEYKPDCLSLRGLMTTNGEDPQIFEHSLKYNEWKDNGLAYPSVRYERYPNHLNVIRADIAKQFKFPETNFGEDHNWSKQLHESGLLKNEIFIDKILYFYKYISEK